MRRCCVTVAIVLGVLALGARVHVLRLGSRPCTLVVVAYGFRVGWALLCTPGVEWTV